MQDELYHSDFFVTLLSAAAVTNDMVQQQVDMAHHLTQQSTGKPVILPVRLAYRQPFQGKLKVQLDALNWSYWRHTGDTPRLIQELQKAFMGKPLPVNQKLKVHLLKPEIHLAIPGGTMAADSPFYIKRSVDKEILDAVRSQQSLTVTIEGPRQVGKSSLLMQVIKVAKENEKQVIYLDFQQFDAEVLKNAAAFFKEFCTWVAETLKLEHKPIIEEYWQDDESNVRRCTRYIYDHVLTKLGNKSLLLAMDEVDRLFKKSSSFRTDFFTMLRSWHNNRAIDPVWKRLDLVMSTSTEPYQLIEDNNQSPFNVGLHIKLKDFTLNQAAELNHSLGSPIKTEDNSALMLLLMGHPYLTHQALYLIANANKHFTLNRIVDQAANDDGPFCDHLRHHLLRLRERDDLLEGMSRIVHASGPIRIDEKVFARLKAAGLVRLVSANDMRPRCQLYQEYFEKALRKHA